MTPKPSSDTGFQIVPSAEPGYDDFRIAVPMSAVRPGTAVPAGTTFANAEVPFKHRAAEGWGTYVAGRRERADDGYLWQNFVRALPTTPTVAEGEFHPIYGRTFVHSYDDLIASTRPDRGDSIDSGSGVALHRWNGSDQGALYEWNSGVQGEALTTYAQRVVLDCTENDLGQGLCEVKVRTVENAQVSIIDDSGIDSETGQLVTQEQTHTLTSTRPTGAGTDDSSYYTLVKRQEHNWYVSTRSKSVTGPTNEAEALSWTKTERTPVYFPPVMIAYKFYAVLDKTSEAYYHKKFSYTMKAAYTGDVTVRYRQWWQKAEPTPVEPVEMLTTGIYIDREWSDSISVEACLHPEILVTENIIGGSVPFVAAENPSLIAQARYIAPATPLLDWPDEVVKFEVERSAGGFLCTERVIEKPTGIISGIEILRLPLEDQVYYLSDYNDSAAH